MTRLYLLPDIMDIPTTLYKDILKMHVRWNVTHIFCEIVLKEVEQ